jgi:hypothetical protein
MDVLFVHQVSSRLVMVFVVHVLSVLTHQIVVLVLVNRVNVVMNRMVRNVSHVLQVPSPTNVVAARYVQLVLYPSPPLHVNVNRVQLVSLQLVVQTDQTLAHVVLQVLSHLVVHCVSRVHQVP